MPFMEKIKNVYNPCRGWQSPTHAYMRMAMNIELKMQLKYRAEYSSD